MKIVTDYIDVSTRGNSEIIDLTRQATQKLGQSGLVNGTITFFVSGSTAGLTTIEYEPGLIKDLPQLYEKIAPQSARYAHDDTWHDGNGHSHVRAALQGPSLVVPFKENKMLLGTWQQIVLIDFDNKSRHRSIVMQMMGE